jgi:hypothetical protein
MKYSIFAFIGAVAAAPTPQFDLGALLGGLGGAGGAGGAAPDLSGILGSLGGLLGGGASGGGGLDLGALLGSFTGGAGGPTGDVAVIINEYGKIKDKVQAMDSWVQKIGDTAPADTIAQLNKMTAEQVEALRAATKAVDGMAGAVDLLSAAGLQGPGGDLTVATQQSIDNLKKAAAAIKKVAGAREAELKNLNAMLDATKAFNEAVNKKLPSFAVSIASGEAQKSVDFLTDAIKVFT